MTRGSTLLAALLVAAGCAGPDLSVVDDATAIDDKHLELADLEPTEWVERYLPDKADDGYTLVLYRRRVPMLIDTSGRVVHLWPLVRAVGRARLATDGRLLVIGTDDLIKIYDWDGRLRWYYRLAGEGDFPHHDVIWMRNGNVLVLAQDKQTRTDYLQEVNRRGRVVWQWRAIDHRDDFPSWNPEAAEPTHVNSVHELPPNRWFDGGDERFRPGNILVSARNLDTVFIIDKARGEVVWKYDRRLDRQHEAVMVPEGQLGAGFIMIFNNGLMNRYLYRRSTVIAVDPRSAKVAWHYGSRMFFSSTGGVQQPLPNGNVMITSSQGGRILEVTPQREIVWQWIPPYLPMRPERYQRDHCPQLARLEAAPEVDIGPRLVRPHVDKDLHTFAVSWEYTLREIAGTRRQIVRRDVDCRELVIPRGASIHFEYGFDTERLGEAELTADFRFTMRPVDGDETKLLHQDTMASTDTSLWRAHWSPVPFRGYRRVEMCLDIEGDGGFPPDRVRDVAVVDNPRIYSRFNPSLSREFRDRELTQQEKDLRERQLRALGYVN
jgi:hypothetical protein